MKSLLTVLLCFAMLPVRGQPVVRFGTLPDEGKTIIRQDGSGTYFTGVHDSKQVVFCAKEDRYYKLFSVDSILLFEGNVGSSCVDCLHREGEWKEYDSAGRLKNKFCYTAGFPNGLQETYHANGKVAERFYFTVLRLEETGYLDSFLSGIYSEYNVEGNLKAEGSYVLNVDSGKRSETEMVDLLTGETTIKALASPKISSEKWGVWKFVEQDGSVRIVRY